MVGLGPKDALNTGRKYDVPEDYVFFPWPNAPDHGNFDWEDHSDPNLMTNIIRYRVGLGPL
jgi:hypothetical protein